MAECEIKVPNTKLRASHRDLKFALGVFLKLGPWCLVLFWSLGVGIWSFPLVLFFSGKLAIQRRQAYAQQQRGFFLVTPGLLERAVEMRLLLFAQIGL
jgi:hypothetical protein